MIRSPILKVLSSIRRHRVKALLMGGQACVFYGAAEFSRDTDLAILPSPENLHRLTQALNELQAENIAVPPFDLEYLKRGHAIHFRCRRPDVRGIRIDIMSEAALNQALFEEERSEREKDRQHWIPLKNELQRLRRERNRNKEIQ